MNQRFAQILILILVGLGILYLGLTYKLGCQSVTKTCTGWDTINPVCLADLANQNLQFSGCTTNEAIMKFALMVFGLVIIVISVIKY